MRLIVSVLVFPMVILAGSAASAQSLSRLVPNLVFADVVLAPGPVDPSIPGVPHTAHFSPDNPLFGQLSGDAAALLASQRLQVPELIRQANAQLSTFPIGTSSGGFTYSFDSQLGTFSRSSNSFGGFLTERALTLGQGQFSYGTVYQHTSYDEFENQSLRNGSIRFYYPHNDCCPGQNQFGQPGGNQTLTAPAFEGDVLINDMFIDLRTDTVAFFATMGVTNALDVGVVVPVVRVALDATVERTINRLSTATNPLIHSFDNRGGDSQVSTASGRATGVGDVLLRGKYQLFARPAGAVAVGGEVRLPTGDETELLGIGAVQGKIALLGSAVLRGLSVHGNLGYTASGSVSDERARNDFVASPGDELNYAFGFDVPVHSRVTAAIDFSGRRLLDVNRLVPATLNVRFATLTDPTVVQTAALPGFELRQGDMDLVLGAAGLKINLARTLLLNTSILFGLSEGGLHNRTTAAVGLDYTFGK
jgi:hypothetical protein